MRFRFRDLTGGLSGPRPIVDVVVDGFEPLPQACLLDGGATAVRFGVTLDADRGVVELRPVS